MKQSAILAGLCYLLLLITIAVYWPGLNGPFLFDDFANLNALGKYNGVRDWDTFKLYLFGNHSGPTGRPISMLSFLLNDNGWPSNPWSFKYTNLTLHILNGLLLFALTRNILIAMNIKLVSATSIALLTAGFWLLHPLNVSTVLYPVQRMTILSALFVLLGLIGYVKGRTLLKTRPMAGYLWMSSSILAGVALATLSKENGALLPLFVACLEIAIFSNNKQRLNKYWVILFLWLPAILLAGYFAYGLGTGGIVSGYSKRPFTLSERLLTEPRILLDYLYYWFIPHVNSPGLLTQDFPLSRSLLNPASTLFSILIISTSIALAIIWSRRYRLLSLSILFYFTGHLIESTFIPLELYFEHRNYLPAMFLGLPISLGILLLLKRHKLWLAAAFLFMAVPASLTAQRASIWSDEELLFYSWAASHPNSQRAQRYAALVAEKNQKPELAYRILNESRKILPGRIAIHLHWLRLACNHQNITLDDQQKHLEVLRNGYFSFRNRGLLQHSIKHIHSGFCRPIKPDFAHRMIQALLENSGARSSAGARHQLHHIRGLLHIAEGKYELAAQDFMNAQAAHQQIESGLYQTALLATHKQYAMALTHLENIENLIGIEIIQKRGILEYNREIDLLRKQIQQDLLNPSQ